MIEDPNETASQPTLFGRSWFVAIAINVVVIGYFWYALCAPASTVKASLLPGTTTHGHYQIELECNACHNPSTSKSDHSSQNVMQDACHRCHADQLQLANDTHPAKKFNDPTNADLLLTLDAQNCLTCHREHVPEQTHASGLTVPVDYCWHCHQDVADKRPSHEGMAFDSCATAGCHNYHDNRALYEKYLNEHFGEPDFLGVTTQPLRDLAVQWAKAKPDRTALTLGDNDGPNASLGGDMEIRKQWAETAHAAAGVNCSQCHQSNANSFKTNKDGSADLSKPAWNDDVSMSTCQQCHELQTDSFVTGRHGMRVGAGMSPMMPAMARLPMHADSIHQELTCTTCHSSHRFDTQFAAVDACLQCHADSHSMAYSDSSHASLWQSELAGDLPPGSGVTCATCHMPRLKDGNSVWVNHDQNANLRPRETMAREVCSHCHGLEFSLSSLSDPDAAATCFGQTPSERNQSVTMAHDYFAEREQARQNRDQRKTEQSTKAKEIYE